MSNNFVFVLLTLVAAACNAAESPAPSPSPSPSPSPAPDKPAKLHGVAVPPAGVGINAAGDVEQTQCKGIPAKKQFRIGSMNDYWAVVKVTPLPTPTPPEFDDKVNYCHPLTYKPGNCQGISMYAVQFEDDLSVTFNTFGYNNLTKSRVHFATNYQKMDPHYAIYQGQPAFMEENFDDGKYKLIDPIPKFILDAQGVEWAQVGKATRNWAIFQVCTTKAAFVILNANTQLRDLLHFEDEYLAELQKLNIDVNTMVDVPIKRNRYDEP